MLKCACMLCTTVVCHKQMLLNVNFSSRTTSMDVQRNLEANVEKRMKDVYGPPPGEWHFCSQTTFV